MCFCTNCENEFEEPIIEWGSREMYYGVASQFDNGTLFKLELCPYCESDGIKKMKGEDEYE